MHTLAATSLPSAESGFHPDVSDADAVKAVIRGDREMFEVIVRRYNPQLYRVGISYLQDHAQTEDMMQNTYLKAFLHLERFRAHAGFGTWLTRIMINECLMALRSRKRFTLEVLDDQALTAEQDAGETPPTEALQSADVKALLENALQALPRAHRPVYLLREIQHLSTAETAQCLGISRENVKVSLHRAREGLRTELLKKAARIDLFGYPARYCDPMTLRIMTEIRRTLGNRKDFSISPVSL